MTAVCTFVRAGRQGEELAAAAFTTSSRSFDRSSAVSTVTLFELPQSTFGSIVGALSMHDAIDGDSVAVCDEKVAVVSVARTTHLHHPRSWTHFREKVNLIGLPWKSAPKEPLYFNMDQGMRGAMHLGIIIFHAGLLPSHPL